jgi:hypothetical protein
MNADVNAYVEDEADEGIFILIDPLEDINIVMTDMQKAIDANPFNVRSYKLYTMHDDMPNHIRNITYYINNQPDQLFVKNELSKLIPVYTRHASVPPSLYFRYMNIGGYIIQLDHGVFYMPSQTKAFAFDWPIMDDGYRYYAEALWEFIHNLPSIKPINESEANTKVYKKIKMDFFSNLQ